MPDHRKRKNRRRRRPGEKNWHLGVDGEPICGAVSIDHSAGHVETGRALPVTDDFAAVTCRACIAIHSEED